MIPTDVIVPESKLAVGYVTPIGRILSLDSGFVLIEGQNKVFREQLVPYSTDVRLWRTTLNAQ